MRLIGYKHDGDQSYRLQGLKRVFIKGDQFTLVLTQDPELNILTIEIGTHGNQVMEPIPVSLSELELERDPQYQILRLKAKDGKNNRQKDGEPAEHAAASASQADGEIA